MRTLYYDDCFNIFPQIGKSAVDLILCDPPYGTIKGCPIEGYKNRDLSWDEALDTNKMFEESERVLRQNGKLLLFSQEPYSSNLITHKNKSGLKFCYKLIWIKDHFANGLMSKKAPVNYFEEILVFTKIHDSANLNPLRNYFSTLISKLGILPSEVNEKLGHRKMEHAFYTTSTQFKVPSKSAYEEFLNVFDLKQNALSYDKLVEIDYKPKVTFNLVNNQKYKSNVLFYKKDYTRFHPTQKPIKLIEDLIYTYSNQVDIVLDFCMGSGTTGVACKNLNRLFIGIEKEEKCFNIAKERIGE